jgi:hypothetical protein
MKQSFRLLAALCGVLMAAASASADPVIFKTEFDFNPSTAAIDSTAALTDGASLTLTGNLVAADVVPKLGLIFGQVSFDPKDSRGIAPVDLNFLMRVTLVSPSGGTETTSNSIWGSINTTSATLSITGGSLLVGGYKFTLSDTDLGLTNSVSSLPLKGDIAAAPALVNAVPVPMAVWGGISLLGILGGGQLWKRRRHLA